LLDATPELRAPIEEAMEQRLAELESLGETH